MPEADAARIWSAYFRASLNASGKTQAELAATLGMTTGNISKWYTGNGYAPRRIEDVIAVAHALGQADATEALEAAGMQRAAQLIRAERNRADTDPMIARIQGEQLLAPDERAALIESYRRAQQETIHYFELQLAEASRRKRAARDRRTGRNGGERAAQ